MSSLAVVRALVVAVLLSAAPGQAHVRPLQLALTKSEPASGATVQAVPEIRLWFSEAPMEMGPSTVTVRVLDAAGTVAASGNAVQDRDDLVVFSLALADGLPPGAYSAAWSTMAEDGETVRGEISFTVAAL